MGYSATPYIFDNQYVTKTIFNFTGPPFSLDFNVYTLDYQCITPHYLTFYRHTTNYLG